MRLLHAFRWPLHRGGRLGHRPDSGRVWAPGGRFEEKDVGGSNENVRCRVACLHEDPAEKCLRFAIFFQPRKARGLLPTPRLRTPRTMLRAVLVVALALGAADAARPLGGAPTPAPTSPIVLGLCDCAFEAYGGCVLGDSTLVRAGRE